MPKLWQQVGNPKQRQRRQGYLRCFMKEPKYHFTYLKGCRCTNLKDCGCTFVVSASFSHYLNPPQKDIVDLAREILKQQEQLNLGMWFFLSMCSVFDC